MGMFDYVECEMELPKLADHSHSWEWKNEHQFQIKDLANALIEYRIDKEGVLYYKKIEYEKRELTDEEQKDKDGGGFWHPMWNLDPVSEEWVKEDFTGYINFYDFIHDFEEGEDAWVEYKVHVKDSVVQGRVELVEFRKECNKERKKSSEKINSAMRARREYQKKWRYRFFGQYWNILINRVFRGVRWLGSKFNNSWKLEDKLKL